jgi:hypothetical protein
MSKYDEAYMTARAFFNALLSGRLSDDASADNYVGDYMYMGWDHDGEDAFKHVETRKYLSDTIERDDEIRIYSPTIHR